MSINCVVCHHAVDDAAKVCPYCGSINGAVRKVSGHPLKIVHIKYDAYNRSTAKSKKPPPGKEERRGKYNHARLPQAFEIDRACVVG